MSALYHKPFSLAPQEHVDANAVANDRFQSPRARKRALALLQLADHVPEDEVATQCAITVPMLNAMLKRYQAEGLRGALFGVERERQKRKYDVYAIARALGRIIKTRPPSGLYWSLKALTESVTQAVPDSVGITEETVRVVLTKKLGIRSVRHIEPYWLQKLKAAVHG